MAKQQDNRENIHTITTLEELAAFGPKKRLSKARARNARARNPLAEEETIKADETHPD